MLPPPGLEGVLSARFKLKLGECVKAPRCAGGAGCHLSKMTWSVGVQAKQSLRCDSNFVVLFLCRGALRNLPVSVVWGIRGRDASGVLHFILTRRGKESVSSFEMHFCAVVKI